MIRKTDRSDIEDILSLYRRVARVSGGVIRLEREMTRDHVEDFVERSLRDGLALVKVDEEDRIVAEIHAYRSDLESLSHALGELTIAVSPDRQGKGFGREIFTEFLKKVEVDMPDILRVELIARESNRRAIEFYRTLGFKIEGEMKKRIRNADGSLESDIPMAWIRP